MQKLERTKISNSVRHSLNQMDLRMNSGNIQLYLQMNESSHYSLQEIQTNDIVWVTDEILQQPQTNKKFRIVNKTSIQNI